jgi:hypothetical protein
VLTAFSGKEAAAMDDDDEDDDEDDDDDSGLDVVAFKEAKETFDSPPTIRGVQRTLDLLARRLEVSAHELVAILRERQATKAYIAHLLSLQQQMRDQAAARGEQGEVEELVAGGGGRDESDGDDEDDEEDELDRTEVVQGSSRQ